MLWNKLKCQTRINVSFSTSKKTLRATAIKECTSEKRSCRETAGTSAMCAKRTAWWWWSLSETDFKTNNTQIPSSPSLKHIQQIQRYGFKDGFFTGLTVLKPDCPVHTLQSTEYNQINLHVNSHQIKGEPLCFNLILSYILFMLNIHHLPLIWVVGVAV